MPATTVPLNRLREGVSIIDLLCETGLAKSRSDARRLVLQGGAYVNDEPVPGLETTVGASDVRDGVVLLRAGKKKYHRVVVQE
jgi:tyrosyl-tRNA synthetase